MLRRLTRLELQGYKTFATKTDIEFGDVTCIVGPNGSGKSNIADGVRWVLGEQSYSLLRGRKTVDMIFSGSEQRSRASMASATIVFDNSDGWLPIDYSEVSLTRRAYRDGQNEYLLNGQKTRLRDVADLLGTVGLAQRTYTVIGQGLVDTALSLKADERRKLFEEAAGIGVYRQKREDALRKLEQTQHNLERVADILAEIHPRLRALERQARRAREFRQLQKDLRHLLRIWYGYHWHASQQLLTQARQQLENRQSQLEHLWQQQHTRSEEAVARREKVAAKRAQLSSWHKDAAKLHEDYQSLHREIAVTEERARNDEKQHERIRSELISFDANLEDQKARLQHASEQLTILANERDQALERHAAAYNQQRERETEREGLEHSESEHRLSSTKITEQLIAQRIRQQTLQESIRQITLEIEGLQIETQQSAQNMQETGRQQDTDEKQLTRAREARDSAEKNLSTLDQQHETNRAEIEAWTDKVSTSLAQVERLRANFSWLNQQQIGEGDTASGPQRLQQAVSSGLLTGHIGRLMDLIKTDRRYEVAIGAVLGESVHASVVIDWPSVEGILELLEQHGGRVTLLPLAKVRPIPTPPAPKGPGFINWALDLVECAPRDRPAIAVFLGQAAICENRAAARRISADLPPGAMCVTLSGEIHRSDGAMFVGRTAADHELVMAREARELPGKIEKATAVTAELEKELRTRTLALDQLQAQRQTALAHLENVREKERFATDTCDTTRLETERAQAKDEWNHQQLKTSQGKVQASEEELRTCADEIKALEERSAKAEKRTVEIQQKLLALDADGLPETVTACQTELAVTERALKDANTHNSEMRAAYERERVRVDARRTQADTIATQISELREKVTELNEHQQYSQLALTRLQGQIDPEEETIHTLEIELVTLDGPEEQFREKVHSGEHNHAQAQVEFQRAQDRLETLQSQVNDDFGLAELEFSEDVTGATPLPFDQLVEHLEYVSELPEGIEKSINRRRVQLRRLGGINPEALQEYNDVKERHEHLTIQTKDLEGASGQLQDVIAELDELMQREFQNTFDAVAKEFEYTFERLFDGGSARLELSDPGDLSTTGVEIIARLPGRRQQGLALLSGGERALVACALIFALLRVSPTPFALLDEVDAMLDESNVGRFRAILREISENTQFVLITHNRHTVEVADTVYGINMGTDSASTVISLKPDEIE